MGLRGDWDFLLHLPLRYLDETRIAPIDAAVPGEWVQVEGEIVDAQLRRAGRPQFVVRLRDAHAELSLRWLHFFSSQRTRLTVGRRVRAAGMIREGWKGAIEMVHPRVTLCDRETPLPDRLTPVYSASEGVSQALLRRRIAKAMNAAQCRDAGSPDAVSVALRERLALPDLGSALCLLHEPPPVGSLAELDRLLAPAWRRLRLDELLAQQLALRRARAQRRGDAGTPLAGDGRLVDALLVRLPFALTTDQHQVWTEIERDLAAPVPMNRLLQGDVGSGKTVVAALAAARAVEAGAQAAIMAPTEILAEQHYRRLGALLAPLGVRVVWLAGRLREGPRRDALAAIESGVAGVVVGTHALIQESVRFAKLALAVVDEQHRFGVAQRLALRQDGACMPHRLMLSATPIPRTLAMSYFADLDVSVIRTLPPGRSPVRTKLVAGSRRDEVLARIRAEAARGRQAYWVCPLVEESDEIDATAAVRMVEETRAALPDLRLGLLHGQMAAAEKTAVMDSFAAGAIDVLVATTVIEVGIDVPNASLMVIEHAQRFGLATLHQLRGRVGRGAVESACVLLFDEPLSETARARLKILYESTDGFEIARADLRLRGPGEFLGARQWGLPMLRVADIERDVDLLDIARAEADRLLREDERAAASIADRWFAGAAAYIGA